MRVGRRSRSNSVRRSERRCAGGRGGILPLERRRRLIPVDQYVVWCGALIQKSGIRQRFARLRKLPSGRYQARHLGPDGQDHPAPHTFANKREAERFLSLIEADVDSGRRVAPSAGKTTVREWANEWFAAGDRSWKPKDSQHLSVCPRPPGPRARRRHATGVAQAHTRR